MTNRRPPSSPLAPPVSLLPRAPLPPALPRLPRGGVTEVVSTTPRPRSPDGRVEAPSSVSPASPLPASSLSPSSGADLLGRPRDDTGVGAVLLAREPARALRITYPAGAREPSRDRPTEGRESPGARFDLPPAEELSLGIAMTRARNRAIVASAVVSAWLVLAATVLWWRGDGFDKALMVAVGGLAALACLATVVLWREARLEYRTARELRLARAQWVTTALSAIQDHSRR